MNKHLQIGLGSFALLAALSSVGCQGSAAPSSSVTGDVIAELQVSAAKRVVFIDEGNGEVGVAEISSLAEPPLVTAMMRSEGATPLEIFLATADEGEEAPERLVENHRRVAARQGREDLTPRDRAAQKEKQGPLLESLAGRQTQGMTSCTATGWEGPTGVWGNPVDSWDVVFTNSTTVYTNNKVYPTPPKKIAQDPAWNGGSGAYHSHGVCLSKDTGDKQIAFTVRVKGNTVAGFPKPVFESMSPNYIIYNDYITPGITTESDISNAGSAAASFRHSAAAWVPTPK